MSKIILLIISGIITSNIISNYSVGADALLLSKCTVKNTLTSGAVVIFASVISSALCRTLLMLLSEMIVRYFSTPIFITVCVSAVYFSTILSRLILRHNYFENYSLSLFASLCGVVLFISILAASKPSFTDTLVFSASTGLGFMLTLFLFCFIKAKPADKEHTPHCLRFAARDLLIASVISLVLYGLIGIV